MARPRIHLDPEQQLKVAIRALILRSGKELYEELKDETTHILSCDFCQDGVIAFTRMVILDVLREVNLTEEQPETALRLKFTLAAV